MKHWFKNFFKKPVKIIFTLLFITLVFVNIQYYDDILAFIAEYIFWFTFGIIGIISFVGIYNFAIKERKSQGLKLTKQQKEEWNNFLKNK